MVSSKAITVNQINSSEFEKKLAFIQSFAKLGAYINEDVAFYYPMRRAWSGG